jgi:hypothetical protein
MRQDARSTTSLNSQNAGRGWPYFVRTILFVATKGPAFSRQ